MTQKPRSDDHHAAKMTLPEMDAFLAAEFPQIAFGGPTYRVEEVGYGTARMRMFFQDRHLRPGGTLSGPSMMALADVALYVALLGAIGPVKLAVTTNLSINFLRRPEPRDVVARCRYLKIGRSLAVGEAELVSDGAEEPCAHVVATYSIPPRT